MSSESVLVSVPNSGSDDTWDSTWRGLVGDVLGIPVEVVNCRAATESFVQLGGTSVRAIEFVALAERRLGRGLDVGTLLGAEPLAVATARAVPIRHRTAPQPADDVTGRASAKQQAMLHHDELHDSTAFHLLFSADIRGVVDVARLRSALVEVTRRHDGLRSVFHRRDGESGVRVLGDWSPRLIRQSLAEPADGDAPVRVVHDQLTAASRSLLRPFERPPVVFVLTRVTADRWILSILIHHVVVDAWSIGLLWRELVSAYEGRAPDRPAPSAQRAVGKSSAATVDRRARALNGAPTSIEIPSDLSRPAVFDHRGARLRFSLSTAARAGCAALVDKCGVTRNTVLLGAWALVVSRRAGVPDVLVGVPAAGRPTEELVDLVGMCVELVPIRCRRDTGDTVAGYLRRLGDELGAALDAQVPFERLVSAIGVEPDPARKPLVQVGFAAHDELVPDRLRCADLSFELAEGYCGGTIFDAELFVQRWATNDTRLALDYAPSVLRADEAAELCRELDRALVEMAANIAGSVADVRAIPPDRLLLLEKCGTGVSVDADAGLWQLVEAVCERRPHAMAVRDDEGVLTYGQLRRAVEAQSAALCRAGVGEGDHVVLALDRSVREIVAVLATLRLGAAYIGVDAGAPAAVVRQVLRMAEPRAILGPPHRIAELAGSAAVGLAVADPWVVAEGDPPPAAPPSLSRIAYVSFTSGSTGMPKGVRIPHRGVVRLAREAEFLADGAADRFLRLAPLAFDASTLEIFAPLLAGGTVEVYPHRHVVPSQLAEFLHDRAITGLWLTAGLFRLVADDQPAAFHAVRQVLTGGDVVPPDQVRRVLRHCPGVRVTNGYGPTENTTFTTVHHVDDPVEVEDPLPIGRPVPGTGVRVLDEDGQPLTPGAVGELCAFGDGLAVDYLGAPEETAASFLTSSGQRYYRTGDLVRWDADGRLRYLGRRDHQVKIRGFRVELTAIARVLREHPLVRDAVVVVPPDPADRRLLAGIVAEPGLEQATDLHVHAAARLPDYAVPTLWTIVDSLPVTGNGKLDVPRLADAAGRSAPPRTISAVPAAEAVEGEVEDLVAEVWTEVLGTADFGFDDGFFDVGGNSLQLLQVVDGLHRVLPDADVSAVDLLAYPTVTSLARYLRGRLAPRRGE